jgi:hypothetical protein
MLKIDLEDLRLEGLQKIAGLYGIQTPGVDRDVLLTRIRDRLPGQWEITLGEPNKAWYRRGSSWMSLAGIVVAALSLVGGWYSIYTTVSKNLEEKLKENTRAWQQVIVYSIIEKGTQAQPRGLSFDEIRDKYVVEAAAAQGVDVPKDKLQPIELKRILTDLISLDQVYQTTEDKYVLKKAMIVEGIDRMFVVDKAKAHVLHVLAIEPAKYTVEELGRRVIPETGITQQEFTRLINELISLNTVTFDTEDRLASRAFPKKKKNDK